MRLKKLTVFILLLCVAMSFALAACDDTGKTGGGGETGTKLELPSFTGQKTDYDKDGLIGALQDKGMPEEVKDSVEAVFDDSATSSAFATEDKASVAQYEKDLISKGFTYGGESKENDFVARMYQNDVTIEGEDEIEYLTQCVFILICDDTCYVMYYEYVQTQEVYKMPNAEQMSAFYLPALPDEGDGRISGLWINGMDALGLVPSIEVRVETGNKEWFNGVKELVENAGYVQDPYEEIDESEGGSEYYTYFYETGKRFFALELFCNSFKDERLGTRYDAELRVYDRVRYDEVVGGEASLWTLYPELEMTYTTEVSRTINDGKEIFTDEHTDIGEIRFDDSFILFKTQSWSDKSETSYYDQPSIGYYDINEHKNYEVVNYGYAKEIDERNPWYFAYEFFYMNCRIFDYALKATDMKKTGNSKQIAGVTVYEYKGYYDYSEEPEEGVYIENKAPMTLWKAENGVVFEGKVEGVETETEIRNEHFVVTSFSTTCEGGNPYSSLPLAYEPGTMPTDIIKQYYGADAYIDEVQGADGYYVEYYVETTWDSEGNAIETLLPTIQVCGVTDSEMRAHKDLLSQKYETEGERWYVKLNATETLVVHISAGENGDGESIWEIKLSKEIYDVPEFFKQEGTFRVHFTVNDDGETERYILIKEGDDFALYKDPNWGEEGITRYSLQFCYIKEGEDAYRYYNNENEPSSQTNTLEEVANDMMRYELFDFVIYDNNVEAGTEEICGVTVTIYEYRGDDGTVYARYYFDEVSGVLMKKQVMYDMELVTTAEVTEFSTDIRFIQDGCMPQDMDGRAQQEVIYYQNGDISVSARVTGVEKQYMDGLAAQITAAGGRIIEEYADDKGRRITATDMENYLVVFRYYSDNQLLTVEESVYTDGVFGAIGIYMYADGYVDIASVYGEGTYNTSYSSTSADETTQSEREIMFDGSAVYNGNWNIEKDGYVISYDNPYTVGTLSVVNVYKEKGTIESCLSRMMSKHTQKYDYAAMVADGIATVTEENVNGVDCYLYQVTIGGEVTNKWWVDKSSGVTVKNYSLSIDIDPETGEELWRAENTSILSFSSDLSEMPAQPDYGNMAEQGEEMSADRWLDDYKVSASVVGVTGFDSFMIVDINEVERKATIRFIGENIALADDPSSLTGYTHTGKLEEGNGDGTIITIDKYDYFDETTGENLFISVRIGDITENGSPCIDIEIYILSEVREIV